MASYDYAMVYLPDYNPRSFLLWDHRPGPGGWASLRDYTRLENGKPKWWVAPPRGRVLLETEHMVTRFPVAAVRVDEVKYWIGKTEEFNRTKLEDAIASLETK